MVMRRISECYSAFVEGESLTNEECIALRNAMKDAADSCFELGERFRLSFEEANERYLRLADICRAREI